MAVGSWKSPLWLPAAWVPAGRPRHPLLGRTIVQKRAPVGAHRPCNAGCKVTAAQRLCGGRCHEPRPALHPAAFLRFNVPACRPIYPKARADPPATP